MCPSVSAFGCLVRQWPSGRRGAEERSQANMRRPHPPLSKLATHRSLVVETWLERAPRCAVIVAIRTFPPSLGSSPATATASMVDGRRQTWLSTPTSKDLDSAEGGPPYPKRSDQERFAPWSAAPIFTFALHVIWTAEPGSKSAEALSLSGSWAVPPQQPMLQDAPDHP